MEWMILPLKRYAEFSGRSRRQEIWLYFLMLFLFFMVMFTILFMVGFGAALAAQQTNAGPFAALASMGIGFAIFGLISLALLIPTIAVQVRRLHDIDWSGWWVMLYYGPYLIVFVLSILAVTTGTPALQIISMVFSLVSWLALIVLIVLYCLPGTVGPNRFGGDPLRAESDLADTFR
jgi:uncharacterized membrane protein YhaH (DUF805 family)